MMPARHAVADRHHPKRACFAAGRTTLPPSTRMGTERRVVGLQREHEVRAVIDLSPRARGAVAETLTVGDGSWPECMAANKSGHGVGHPGRCWAGTVSAQQQVRGREGTITRPMNKSGPESAAANCVGIAGFEPAAP
jgi:hypothetical protein